MCSFIYSVFTYRIAKFQKNLESGKSQGIIKGQGKSGNFCSPAKLSVRFLLSKSFELYNCPQTV